MSIFAITKAVSSMDSKMAFRTAVAGDMTRIESLIRSEKNNPLVWMPDKVLRKHFQDLADGKAGAVVAVEGEEIVGVASYEWGDIKPQFSKEPHGYIYLIIVKDGFRNLGRGTQLAKLATQELAKKGYSKIFAERQVENAASERMVKNAGFQDFKTFYDPDRRTAGSRKTTVGICTVTQD